MYHAPDTVDRGVSALALLLVAQHPGLEAGPHTDDCMRECGSKVGPCLSKWVAGWDIERNMNKA